MWKRWMKEDHVEAASEKVIGESEKGMVRSTLGSL